MIELTVRNSRIRILVVILSMFVGLLSATGACNAAEDVRYGGIE